MISHADWKQLMRYNVNPKLMILVEEGLAIEFYVVAIGKRIL